MISLTYFGENHKGIRKMADILIDALEAGHKGRNIYCSVSEKWRKEYLFLYILVVFWAELDIAFTYARY